MNFHVDDILLVCKPEEVQWFQDAVGSTLTMKVDGPHLPASGEQLMYLKKRITMREDGILIRPHAPYVPTLVAMMKVSGRRKKGLPYHATLETFNAEFVVEPEMLGGEQAGLFRSGLGLTLYMAMDRLDIQFAVKGLSSYMSRPSVKALSALEHLASYLEGTPDDGILLRSTEEGKMVSDFWKENDFIQDEVTIPDWTADGRFILEAFSDSSWTDCKTTRMSTSSGVIFLTGSLLTSICQTQASVALSSCEAELYAANGLMVESLFLHRLCKFLVGDESEGNSDKVQQRLYMDSASALAPIRRTGTGRLKHIQIKQFFLQNLLRTGVFSISKVHTKLNPGDLNTTRLGGERRRFLGRLMRLLNPNDAERHDDNAVRRIRKINRATREQCVRLIQMANVTMGMCMQLKGCNSEVFSHHGPVTGGSADDGKLQMVWWMLVEWLSTPAQCAFGGLMMAYKVLSVMAQFIGFAMMFAAVGFACAGPMVWSHYGWLQQFALRHAAWLVELRFRALVKPSLWVAWWILKKEIAYLHERYRESEQRGDFMVDVENVYGCLDEYLTDGNFPVGAGVLTHQIRDRMMDLQKLQKENLSKELT